jgi:FAD synthase
MRHYHSLEEVSAKNAWLTIGVFDGIHRGIAKSSASSLQTRTQIMRLRFY